MHFLDTKFYPHVTHVWSWRLALVACLYRGCIYNVDNCRACEDYRGNQTRVCVEKAYNKFTTWASWQIRKIACCACAGNAGNAYPTPQIRDPGMHQGTCVPRVPRVPWCMPRSLTCVFLWSRWRGKRYRHSRCMRYPQFYVSGKRPIDLGKESRMIRI